MKASISAASIVLSIGAVQSVFTSPVVAAGQTAEKKKCYGVSLKDKNASKAGADTYPVVLAPAGLEHEKSFTITRL